MAASNSSSPPVYLELAAVSKDFDGVPAVSSVDLRIRRGEIFAILGPSGCGKSTLLRLLAGLERLSAGDMLIEGVSVAELPPYRRPVNMMFQSYALFPHMTIEQNIAFGLKQDRLARDVIDARVSDALELVKMSDFRLRRPDQVSGGQQQRVALARSLVKQPKVLLLDEPMGALDRKLRAEMQFELAEIIRRVRVTCVMVTHDQEEAMVMADRIGLMNEGRIVQVGPPAEVYEMPNSRFSAGFLGAVNLLEGSVSSSTEGLLVMECPDTGSSLKAFHDEPLPSGRAVALAVRPEKIRISESETDDHHNSVTGIIEEAAYVGTHTNYQVRLASGRMLTVLMTSHGAPKPHAHGTRVSVSWDMRDGVLLPH